MVQHVAASFSCALRKGLYKHRSPLMSLVAVPAASSEGWRATLARAEVVGGVRECRDLSGGPLLR